jgi:cell division transport system permease protein
VVYSFAFVNQSEKHKRRKPSGWPSVMSLSLVMFILSIWGISILAFDSLVKNMVEETNLDIYFVEQTTEEDITAFIQAQEKSPVIKKSVYISQEQGFEEFMQDESNKEMLDFVSAETLPKSIELYFNAAEDMGSIMSQKAKELRSNPLIEDVVYNPNLVKTVTKNVRIAQLVLLGACFIFIVVAIGLIQSSTRLSIFAKRFIIKSMQLLGATNSFIVRPFITKYVGFAVIAFILSISLTLGLVLLVNQTWPKVIDWNLYLNSLDYGKAALIFGSIAMFGVLLAIICVWLSTRKYLRTKLENLY